MIPSRLHCDVRLETYKQATFCILDWGSWMASGERSIKALAIPGISHIPGLQMHERLREGSTHGIGDAGGMACMSTA